MLYEPTGDRTELDHSRQPAKALGKTGSGNSQRGDKRYFTPEHANRALVLVRRIVSEIVTGYARLLEIEEMIESAERTGSNDGLEQARKRLVKTVDDLQTCLDELDQIGVELRDFSRGIVDFPSIHEDREIKLCWLLGEESVCHWHEAGAGFACRQPLCLLGKNEILQPTLF
ncbi:MAG TPA: DUF2203 domain-containing protein [Phycisphaerae bacterium]|nr:DUF2203 domain-containing protein [Phycisphaerae bacterium]